MLFPLHMNEKQIVDILSFCISICPVAGIRRMKVARTLTNKRRRDMHVVTIIQEMV